jgi:hypothetical protein
MGVDEVEGLSGASLNLRFTLLALRFRFAPGSHVTSPLHSVAWTVRALAGRD